MKRRLKWQIILQIMLSITLASSLLFSYVYVKLRSTSIHNIQDGLEQRVLYSSSEVDKILLTRIKLVESFARNIKNTYNLPEAGRRHAMETLTEAMLRGPDPYVYGYSFTMESTYQNQGKYCSWFMKEDGRIVNGYSPAMDDASEAKNADDPGHDWFFGAKRDGKTHITVPYLDPYIHEWMVSITTPVYDDNHQLMGVAGMDINLDGVRGIGEEMKIGKSGYGAFVAHDGSVVYHPQLIQSQIEGVGDPELLQFFRTLQANSSGATQHMITKKAYYYEAQIPSANWHAMVVVPRKDVEGGMNRILILSIAFFLLFLCCCYVMVHIWVDRTIQRPLSELVKGTDRISAGILTQFVDVRGDNELSEVAQKFNDMMDTIHRNWENEQELKKLSSLKIVGEMASIISHEVRSPLETIQLYLMLMSKASRTEEEKQYIRIMLDEVNRAYAMVSEYLSLASHKTSDLRKENLNRIILNLYPLLQALAHAKGHHIDLDLGDIPDTKVDHKEIRQLLHNLIRNGLEAMEKGGTITIRTRPVQDKVQLIIEDQGKGMDEHILKRIGTPFLTTKEHGTGLGLLICLKIIQRHQALYGIETSDSGTKFEVTFGQQIA